jgi:hypothetical protein
MGIAGQCTGPRGLVLAVIAQAYQDLIGDNDKLRAAAVEYFKSTNYRTHLQWAGLPDDWYPLIRQGKARAAAVETHATSARKCEAWQVRGDAGSYPTTIDAEICELT